MRKGFDNYYTYRKVASSNTSFLEAQIVYEGIFDPYVLWPFDKKWIS